MGYYTSNDALLGGMGDDTLGGGLGIDHMARDTGDDMFVVSTLADIVVERANEGNDAIVSSLTYSLAANFECLVPEGNRRINGTGNDLSNGLYGNEAGNRLTALAGNVCLLGYGGNDFLSGGGGSDRMTGGDGGDAFGFGLVSDKSLGAGRDIITDF